MDDSKRPGNILLLKSYDGVSYEPWVYRVTSEYSCRTTFNTRILYSPRNQDSILCLGFSKMAAPRYEKVSTTLGGKLLPGPKTKTYCA